MAKIGKVNKKILRKFGGFGKVLSKIGKIGLSTGAMLGIVAPELALPMLGGAGALMAGGEAMQGIGRL